MFKEFLINRELKCWVEDNASFLSVLISVLYSTCSIIEKVCKYLPIHMDISTSLSIIILDL